MGLPERTIQWTRRVAGFLLLIGAGVVLGFLVSRGLEQTPASGTLEMEQETAESQQKWYCSMHPQIVQDGPGECPICLMDLIPMPQDLGVDTAPRELVVSEVAAALMDIETSPVERKSVATEVRMVGKVDYDETRVRHIAAWVPGRIDRLYVDFTGTTVAGGDHLVYLYSPELISAQAELLQAAKAAGSNAEDVPEYLRRSNRDTLAAAREKLRLLGLAADQIKSIEASGKPLTHVTIHAPIGGVVIEKMANEGMYVDTGTHIYTVADLTHVWVRLDAYESDLPWIRYGQSVRFTTEAYPGEIFEGRISLIDPVLNPRTRTVKVRVNVPNPDGRLRPEMFVRAVVESQLAQEGRVMHPDMAGRWVCPMHPSVIKGEPGLCDICEMDLVTTESLGYVAAAASEPPLVVPATAPLITGRRAVVYVKKADTERPTFEGREVVLGPRAGAYYIVESGLDEGEMVVTHGNFKIDSALQIQAKPSMMNPAGNMPAGETMNHMH
jgi:Cu(I)/Ag(I) efflux system membrane fusion protein